MNQAFLNFDRIVVDPEICVGETAHQRHPNARGLYLSLFRRWYDN